MLKQIKENGVYLAKYDSLYKSNTPICYNLIFNNIKNKHPQANNPIFGWYAVIDNDNNNLKVDARTIKRCLEMTSFDEHDYLILELEKNEDEVSLQDFYNFVDARCEEEGFDTYYDKFEDFPFETVFEYTKYSEIQCVFSHINKADIKNIYSYKKDDNCYIIKNSIILILFQNKSKLLKRKKCFYSKSIIVVL